MPKIEKIISLEITPEQFLNNCSSYELQELELLLSRDFYQNRKNNTQQCKVCGCTEYNCNNCVKITGQPCYWIEIDLCSRCETDIKTKQILYDKNLSETEISIKLLIKLKEFFSIYYPENVDELKISSLHNFDLNSFSKQRGNGEVTINEILIFCKKNKIAIKK